MTDDETDGDRKRRRVLRLQRYVLNPPMKALAWLGAAPGHVLLETTGRRTGRPRRTVVGADLDDHGGWVIAEQGRHASYVRNLEASPLIRVRVRGRWRRARAFVDDADDPEARLDAFGRKGHARAVRSVGTDLASVRFDYERDEPVPSDRQPDGG